MTTLPPKIRLGILGTGVITSGVHIESLSKLTDTFEITHLCDLKDEHIVTFKERAKKLGLDPNTFTRIASMDELFSLKELDAVFIALPPFSNAAAAKKACEAGKHVFVEKPMGDDLADAEQLLHAGLAAEKRGQCIMVAENFYFYDHFEKLRQMAHSGQWPYGPPIFIEMHQFWKMTPQSIPEFYYSDWRHDPRWKWGYLIEGGCHSANPVREAFGMPIHVNTQLLSADQKLGAYDTIISHFQLDGDTRSSKTYTGPTPHFQMTVSYGCNGNGAPHLTLYSKDGTIVVDGGIKAYEQGGPKEGIEIDCPKVYGDGYFAEWLEFAAAIYEKRRPVLSIEQTYGDIEFMQRIIDAAGKIR